MKLDSFEALSLLFYQGVYEPKYWQMALQELTRLADAEIATLLLWGEEEDQVLVTEQVGVDMALLGAYQQHYQYLDKSKEAGGMVDECRWYIGHRELGAERISQSEFYQDFLKPNGLSSAMGTQLAASQSGMRSVLALNFAWDDMTRLEELERKMGPLALHIRQARNMKIQNERFQIQQRLQQQALDLIPRPVMILSLSGELQLQNTAASRWLQHAGRGAIRVQYGITSLYPDLAASLASFDGVQAKALRWRAEDGLHALLLQPLPATLLDMPIPCAMLLVHPPVVSSVPAALLADWFGLTPAEKRFLPVFMQEDTLAETATQLGVSTETAKTHKRNVFIKAGVSRKAELYRLLAGMFVPES